MAVCGGLLHLLINYLITLIKIWGINLSYDDSINRIFSISHVVTTLHVNKLYWIILQKDCTSYSFGKLGKVARIIEKFKLQKFFHIQS